MKVKAIIDDYSFEIYDDIQLTEIEKVNLFVYGKKVNDFLKLDYSSLYSLNIKGTQELYIRSKQQEEQIQKQQEIVNNLLNRISNLESLLIR